MHRWGTKDLYGRDICARVSDAAVFIGYWLRKYARMNVFNIKEKFGTVRIYCSFGWEDLHHIVYPGHHYYRFRPWLMVLNRYTKWLVRILGIFVVPIQKILYRRRYKQAITEWPELRQEILCCADYPELLRGL